jgi:hypothetical protein
MKSCLFIFKLQMAAWDEIFRTKPEMWFLVPLICSFAFLLSRTRQTRQVAEGVQTWTAGLNDVSCISSFHPKSNSRISLYILGSLRIPPSRGFFLGFPFSLFGMSFDSLNNELDEQFDRAFGSLANQPLPILPIRALKHSRESVSTVAAELYSGSTKVVDHQGFVRFLSTCPAPVVDEKDVQLQGFIGSGWTMSVFRGKWKTAGKVRAVAVKYVTYVP